MELKAREKDRSLKTGEVSQQSSFKLCHWQYLISIVLYKCTIFWKNCTAMITWLGGKYRYLYVIYIIIYTYIYIKLRVYLIAYKGHGQKLSFHWDWWALNQGHIVCRESGSANLGFILSLVIHCFWLLGKLNTICVSLFLSIQWE